MCRCIRLWKSGVSLGFCPTGTIGTAFWDKDFHWFCCSPARLLSPGICLSTPPQYWDYGTRYCTWSSVCTASIVLTQLSSWSLHVTLNMYFKHLSHIFIHGSLLFHKHLLAQVCTAWPLLSSCDYFLVYLLIMKQKFFNSGKSLDNFLYFILFIIYFGKHHILFARFLNWIL